MASFSRTPRLQVKFLSWMDHGFGDFILHNIVKMRIFTMDRNAGFYSMFFHAINHYIHCKKQGISFKLDTSQWLFTPLHI